MDRRKLGHQLKRAANWQVNLAGSLYTSLGAVASCGLLTRRGRQVKPAINSTHSRRELVSDPLDGPIGSRKASAHRAGPSGDARKTPPAISPQKQTNTAKYTCNNSASSRRLLYLIVSAKLVYVTPELFTEPLFRLLYTCI